MMVFHPLVLAMTLTPAAAHSALEGRWRNPSGTVIIVIATCDADVCGLVQWASDKALDDARKGGTEHFIGTEILHVSQAGNNLYRGKAFDPESNMHIPATVRFVDAGTIEIQGCALFGLICKTQRWTKVD